MERNEQFEILQKAKSEITKWAAKESIDLHQIEFVVPFVEKDLSLYVWFFYKTKQAVSLHKGDGISDKLKKQFMQILLKGGYPENYLAGVDCGFDSDENVKKNYKGNYFYRLR